METADNREGKTFMIISEDQAFQREALENIHASGAASRLQIVNASFGDFQQHKKPEIVLIDLSEGELGHVEFAKNFCASMPGVKVICAGSNLNVDHVLYLLKIGVHHFLKTPFDHHEVNSLLFALTTESNNASASAAADKAARKGKIITVYSPKGGSGVTLLAINLAVELFKEKKDHRILVCDLAPQTGDVATYLNLNPKYTIHDLIENIARMDTSLLDGVLMNHESGIRVLASPALDQEALSVHYAREWESILQILKKNFDLIIIDSAHADESLLQHTLCQSDSILLMGNLDVPSLKGVLFGLTKLGRMHIEPERIKIIINRYNAKNQLDIKEFAKNAKHPVECKLPNNYSVCIESINTGKPVSLHQAGSDLGRKIKELADEIMVELTKAETAKTHPALAEEHAPAAGIPKKGLWGWML